MEYHPNVHRCFSTKAYHPAKKEAESEKINPKAGERASPPGGKAAAKVEIITRNTKHKNYFLSEKYKEKGKWKRDRRLRTRKKQRREDEAGKQERKVHIIILYARERQTAQEDPSHHLRTTLPEQWKRAGEKCIYPHDDNVACH